MLHSVRNLSILLAMSLLTLLGCRSPQLHKQESRTQRTRTLQDGTTITDVHLWSASLGDMLRYSIIIPKHQTDERLPVLYFLHGANSGPDEIFDRSNIVHLASLHHLIVV